MPNPLGFNVLIANHRIVPKIKISESCPVSDEFRGQFNAWLEEMFGTKIDCLLNVGQVIILGNHTILVHPNDYGRMQAVYREWR